MKTAYRLRVVLGLMPNNYPDLLDRGKAIHNGLAAHPQLFVKPDPALTTLKDRIDALDQAQQLAATRAAGTVAARNVRGEELISCLESTRAYVQERVDESPEQGMALIEAAAMRVPKSREYSKPLITASQDKASGPVRVVVNVGALTAGIQGKVSFNWQVSANGGALWSDLPSTPLGHTEVPSLTPLATYAFRVSVTAAKGTGEWSQAVTLLVR